MTRPRRPRPATLRDRGTEIRNIDHGLYTRLRQEALGLGVPIGALVNQAIREYIETLDANRAKEQGP